MHARHAVAIAVGLALALLPRPFAGLHGLGVLAVPAVAASCATTPSIDEAVALADIVFVGTVLHTENNGRWATVRVEERWRGARNLGETVEVRGGPEAGTASTTDRTFATSRYLFVVSEGPGGAYLVDDQCTATKPWTADLARLRPIDVSPAPDVVAERQVSELDFDRILPVAALFGALIIAVISYIVILRARRRPPDWIR